MPEIPEPVHVSTFYAAERSQDKSLSIDGVESEVANPGEQVNESDHRSVQSHGDLIPQFPHTPMGAHT